MAINGNRRSFFIILGVGYTDSYQKLYQFLHVVFPILLDGHKLSRHINLSRFAIPLNIQKVSRHKKLVKVFNPGRRAGVVQFYEFVMGTNPGSEAGFVTIPEARF